MDNQTCENMFRATLICVDSYDHKILKGRIMSPYYQDCVLFESTIKGGMMFGYTGNYVRVKIPYRRDLINKICRVKLVSMDANHDVNAEIAE